METLTDMKNSKLKALVFSDVHLYHDKTKTEHIVRGLFRALPDSERMRDIDIIFISGDLFDHEVFMPHHDSTHVIRFIYHLLNLCSKYDIVLRILEGTPGHDWKQAKLVIDINNNLPNPVDVKHATTLSIEHIERFGIDVLYVPDEWGTSCSNTFLEVRELLDAHNLEKVDLAIMHGCFNYQFPVNLVGKPDVHNESSYLDITRYFIIIGHYHTHSTYERIIVPGSFDRLKHGEEEPKGYLEFTIYDTGAYDYTFIENPDAMIHKTFDCSDTEVGEVVKHIARYLNGSQEECFIRIMANKEDAIYSGMKELKAIFPFVNFTVTLKDRSKTKDKMVSETQDIVRPSSLLAENIIELMRARVESRYPEYVDEYIDLLKGEINE